MLGGLIRSSALAGARYAMRQTTKSSIVTQSMRTLRTIPMDSYKVVVAEEQPILTPEQAAQCFQKKTMTYGQAIDYLFYMKRNSKNSLFKAFILAALLGFVVSSIVSSTSKKLEQINYDAVANAILETKTLNPITIVRAIYSALDITVPNKEYYTEVTFPQTCTVATHRIVELPASEQRKKLNNQRVKYDLPPLPPLTREDMTTRPAQLLAVGLRAMGGFDAIPYVRAYTFGLYMNSEVLPDIIKVASEQPEVIPNPETAILAHNVADKTLRLVFCQGTSGKHIADGFLKSFGPRISKTATGDCEDGEESGRSALDKLTALFALVPQFKTGDEITLTWSTSGALVVTLPDHTLDKLDFYKEAYHDEEALQNRKRLRDTEEWREIVSKIRAEKPAYPAPTLQLSSPTRPLAILQSPTLCRAVFQSFVEEKGVAPVFHKALDDNWNSILDQFEK